MPPTAWANKVSGTLPSDRLRPTARAPTPKATKPAQSKGTELPKSEEVRQLEALLKRIHAPSAGQAQDPKGGCFCQGMCLRVSCALYFLILVHDLCSTRAPAVSIHPALLGLRTRPLLPQPPASLMPVLFSPSLHGFFSDLPHLTAGVRDREYARERERRARARRRCRAAGRGRVPDAWGRHAPAWPRLRGQLATAEPGKGRAEGSLAHREANKGDGECARAIADAVAARVAGIWRGCGRRAPAARRTRDGLAHRASTRRGRVRGPQARARAAVGGRPRHRAGVLCAARGGGGGQGQDRGKQEEEG
jgi:hypothetical protein